MKVPAEPVFFSPIYKETLWGGTALRTRFNRPLSPGQRVGESWEIANLGADQSAVASGPLAGASLSRLMAETPDKLLGNIENCTTFPLLYKFIDAQDRLSVQVHPNDDQARANGWGEFGKTECWYVINAKGNARIIAGFKTDITRETLARAVESASLHELLTFIPVASGDVIFLPAGIVHAILEGVLLYEVQETSDTTLRLYDWARVDAQGRSRQLHVQEALSVIDMSCHGDCRISPITFEEHGYRHSFLVACRYFALERFSLLRSEEIVITTKQSFSVLTVISGSFLLRYPAGTAVVPSGTTVLLPAGLRDIRAAGAAGTEAIISWVPDLQREIVTPLRDKGVPDAAILQLGGIPEHNDLLHYLN